MNTTEMPAVVVRETGEKEDWHRLELDQVERPQAGAGEVLVQVEACSVNRADLLQRRGLYPPPLGASLLLGLDYAGFIVETAGDVHDWHVGDRVFGIVAGGSYARYLTARADHLVRIPDTLSFVEAAAAAEVFFAAFVNLFFEGELQTGETLLLHGGGSGVGTAAIQLAATAGANVVITAGSADKVRRCLQLGAHSGINYREEDFAERARQITGGEGVDLILDWIGAPYLQSHLDLLKVRGRLVIMGLMGGKRAELPLAPVLGKRLRIIGSVLRSRSDQEKALITQAFRERVLPLLASGTVRPIVDRVFSIQEAEAAHMWMRDGRHFGKIVLTWHTPLAW
jgi:putative PIG3 family NAD(P)H quinone oxidoreductase